MIHHSNCYRKLNQSSVIVEYFKNSGELEYSSYYGFDVSPVPLDIILQEPILATVNSRHKIKTGGVIRLKPQRCYRWHQDALRGVCVNLLLEHKDSFVLFGNDTSDSEDQFEIIKMDYDIGYFYLFNNQAMHTVINLHSPRYMFTVEFEQDKNTLSFSDIKI